MRPPCWQALGLRRIYEITNSTSSISSSSSWQCIAVMWRRRTSPAVTGTRTLIAATIFELASFRRMTSSCRRLATGRRSRNDAARCSRSATTPTADCAPWRQCRRRQHVDSNYRRHRPPAQNCLALSASSRCSLNRRNIARGADTQSSFASRDDLYSFEVNIWGFNDINIICSRLGGNDKNKNYTAIARSDTRSLAGSYGNETKKNRIVLVVC